MHLSEFSNITNIPQRRIIQMAERRILTIDDHYIGGAGNKRDFTLGDIPEAVLVNALYTIGIKLQIAGQILRNVRTNYPNGFAEEQLTIKIADGVMIAVDMKTLMRRVGGKVTTNV